MEPRHTIIDTELGRVTLVARGGSLAGLYFDRHWHLPAASEFGPRVEDDPFLDAVATELREYLAGERTSFDLAVTTRGDPFQEKVWTMLAEIPFGEKVTYGELAERLGDKSLARAVGQAVGHNPVGVVIPCHRVVGSNGKLTGYAGGLERKAFLLELEEPEAAEAGRLF